MSALRARRPEALAYDGKCLHAPDTACSRYMQTGRVSAFVWAQRALVARVLADDKKVVQALDVGRCGSVKHEKR